MKGTTRTFILGPGILVTPDGKEYKVTEFTLTQGDPEVIKEGDNIIHIGKSKIPSRIEFRNNYDEN